MKQVLFIAYQIPPVSGAAAQRHLRFLTHLNSQGWRPHILTGRPNTLAEYFQTDPGGMRELPAAAKIYRAREFNPFERLLSLRSRFMKTSGAAGIAPSGEARGTKAASQVLKDVISDVFRFPDRQNGWYPFALIKGLGIIRKEKIHVIYASGNPWTSFLIAVSLSLLTRIPVAVDFRDPWVQNPYAERKGWLIESSKRLLEAWIIRRAAYVVANTDQLKLAFCKAYPDHQPKFVHISNGYSESLFKDIVVRSKAKEDSFILSHVGTLYSHRSPVQLFKVLARLLGKGRINKGNFLLRFVGRVDDLQENKALIKTLKIEEIVSFSAPVPHAEALSLIHQSDLLLILQQGTTLQIPGKLFEYMAIGKPVFALTDKGATREIIESENLGLVADPEDLDSIEATLEQFLALHEQNQLSKWVHNDTTRKYESRILTAELVLLFEKCLGRGRV